MSFINDNDNLRTTQLVQDFHPVLRRRAYTSIRTSFPTYFNTQHQHQQQTPLPSMNQSQKIIYDNFSKINHIIDVVDQHIRKRIQCYQNEVVNVVQKEIQQMRQQTQKVVIQFNNMILQKNKQTQIWSLNNELDYFKSQAKKLFESNKQLKKQYLQMKKRIQQYEWQLQNREVIMQKLLYKYQKQRHSKNKLKEKMTVGKEMIKFSKKESDNGIGVGYLAGNNKDNNNTINNNIINNNSNININHENSLLQINIDDNDNQQQEYNYKNSSLLQQHLLVQHTSQQQQSRIQFVSKNSHQNKYYDDKKPKQIDQQSQVNIYLSQHSYKTLFEKKSNNNYSNKNRDNTKMFSNTNTKSFYYKNKETKEISTQTDHVIFGHSNHLNHPNDYQRRKQQNDTKQSTSSPKTKSINFAKNGFTIRQGSIQKNHLRSNSYHMNSTMKRDINSNGFAKQMDGHKKKQKINTQMNFNKSLQREFQFQMLTPKIQKEPKNKNHTKMFNKMASKFQRNKIAQRAYDKSISSSVAGKK